MSGYTHLCNALSAIGFASQAARDAVIQILYIAKEVPVYPAPAIDPKAYIETLEQQGYVFSSDAKAYHSLHTLTQNYLKRSTTERQELTEENPLDRPDIKAQCDALGMFNEVPPRHKSYDVTVVLGATPPTVALRCGYYEDLQHRAVMLGNVYLLGDKQREFPMMKLCFATVDSTHAACVEALPGPTRERANTDDTVKELLIRFAQDNIPKNASIMFISNQPHIAYQDEMVLHQLRAAGYANVEMAGPGCLPDARCIPIAVDSIARRIDAWGLNRRVLAYNDTGRTQAA